MSDPFVILPSEFAGRIAASPAKSGVLDIRADYADRVFVVDGFSRSRDGGGVHGGSRWVSDHYLHAASRARLGVWYEAELVLHAAALIGAQRSGMMHLSGFRESVRGSWIGLSHGAPTLAVTYADVEKDDRHWQAWELSLDDEYARPVGLEVVDEDAPLLLPLREHWPLEELGRMHVVLIGAGSIGSHANDALAAYGVRHLTLVDPDRLLSHNFARHRAHSRELGRFKVTAERERLLERDGGLRIDALPMDVVYDADIMRPIFAEADLILVTADGIDARRAANHLARRAGTPALFACVLENGAYGEIICVDSPSAGCLLCLREHMREQNQIEPELSLDRGYGTGTRHLPMTAVTGDLALIAQVAAKAAVATLLGSAGHRDQRLPGGHAVISLRPRSDTAAPFDDDEALALKWDTLPAPRAGCPTCSGL